MKWRFWMVALAIAAFSTPARTQSITVQDDPYHPRVIFYTEVQTIGAAPRAYLFMLLGSIDRATKLRKWQIQWSAVYHAKEWHHYRIATLEGGVELPQIERSSKVLNCSGRGAGCSYQERLVFGMTEAQVKAGARSGLRLKMFGKSGNETFATVSADEVANLLQKMNSYGK